VSGETSSKIESAEEMARRLERELGSDCEDPLRVIRARDAQIAEALRDAVTDTELGEIIAALGSQAGHAGPVLPGSAPLSYVTREGVVRIPDEVRKALGLEQGGGVCFVPEKDDKHYRMLTNAQFWDLFEPREGKES
jgi:hypothetical protein